MRPPTRPGDGIPGAIEGLRRAPVVVLAYGDPERYVSRYREPDKAGPDGADVTWVVPFWFVDVAFATMTLLLQGRRCGYRRRVPRELPRRGKAAVGPGRSRADGMDGGRTARRTGHPRPPVELTQARATAFRRRRAIAVGGRSAHPSQRRSFLRSSEDHTPRHWRRSRSCRWRWMATSWPAEKATAGEPVAASRRNQSSAVTAS